MLAAFASSALFLTSYLVYHAEVGSVPYQGQGVTRTIYYVILLTHVLLAAAILPLALITLSRALAKRFDRHKKIARWTLPIWLYVSVTGVVIYRDAVSPEVDPRKGRNGSPAGLKAGRYKLPRDASSL